MVNVAGLTENNRKTGSGVGCCNFIFSTAKLYLLTFLPPLTTTNIITANVYCTL